MIIYFIGGSKDLSKQVVSGMPGREMQVYRPHSLNITTVDVEHYMCCGHVPNAPEPTYVYAFQRITTQKTSEASC